MKKVIQQFKSKLAWMLAATMLLALGDSVFAADPTDIRLTGDFTANGVSPNWSNESSLQLTNTTGSVSYINVNITAKGAGKVVEYKNWNWSYGSGFNNYTFSTGNYTVAALRSCSNGGCTLEVKDQSKKFSGTTVYLDLRNFTSWENDGVTFKAHLYIDNGTDNYFLQTIDFAVTSTAHVYEATITTTAPVYSIKAQRFSGTTGHNSVTVKDFGSSNNCIKITGWDAGEASSYTACTPPTVTTGTTLTDLSASGVKISGSSYTGGTSVTQVGYVYGTSASPTGNETSCGTTSFSTATLSNLSANTKYYYRAYVKNACGTTYGPDKTFTTYKEAPSNLYIKGPMVNNGVWTDDYRTNWASVTSYTHSGNVYTYKINASNAPGDYNQPGQFCVSTSTGENKIHNDMDATRTGWAFEDNTEGKNFIADCTNIVTSTSSPITLTITFNQSTGKYTMTIEKDCTNPASGFTQVSSVYNGGTSPWNTTFANDHRSAVLSTTLTGLQYQWVLCNSDGTGEVPSPTAATNHVTLTDATTASCTATFDLPGTYYFKLKAGCTEASVPSEVLEVNVPFPEMRVTGPFYTTAFNCNFSGDVIDGKMDRDGLTWTKDFTINNSADAFAVVQRYKNNEGKCDAGNDNSAGWTHWVEYQGDYNKIPMSSTITPSGVVLDGNNFKQSGFDPALQNGDKVRLTVTMNAYNNYSVTLEKRNMYNIFVAVKSWGNDNNTTIHSHEWYDFLNYQSSVVTVPIVVENSNSEELEAGQTFTATARPYTSDGIERSIFLGWSTTPDGWDADNNVSRQVGMESYDKVYTIASVSADVTIFAHFGFIDTEVAQSGIGCNSVNVVGSVKSYADNINVTAGVASPAYDYGYTSKIGYKVGDAGALNYENTTGDIITTWPQHQRAGWVPVTATLSNLASNTTYKYQHILVDSQSPAQEHYAHTWSKFISYALPVIVPSATSATQYKPITLTSTGSTAIKTWEITTGSGGYLSATSGSSVTFKGSSNVDSAKNYVITATDDNNCSSTVNLTISPDSETCN